MSHAKDPFGMRMRRYYVRRAAKSKGKAVAAFCRKNIYTQDWICKTILVLDSIKAFGYKRVSFCPDSSVGRAED